MNPITTGPASLESLLQKTYNLFGFGQTVLIPLNGRKLVDSHRRDLSLEQTHQADNLFLLACYDIGVVCGKQSGSLACVQFGSESDRASFLAQNPRLSDTLLTSGPEGFLVWLRINGWHPGTFPANGCNWISEGLILVADRAKESKCRFDNQSPPVTINFKEIVWRPDLAIYWASTLAERDCGIVVADREDNPVINDAFVCRMFMNLHADVSFNPLAQTFYRQIPGGPAGPFYVAEVKKSLYEILEYIRLHTAKPHFKAAIAAAGKAPLYVDTGLKQLGALAGLLKILAVKAAAVEPRAVSVFAEDPASAFEQFVITEFENVEGADVTVAEALSAYAEYCAQSGYPLLSNRQFHERLARSIKETFNIDKSHSTSRFGSSRRGFRNLRLKAADNLDSGTLRTTGTTAFVESMDQCHADLTAYLAIAA